LHLNETAVIGVISLADGDANWNTTDASCTAPNAQRNTFSDCRRDERVTGNRQSGGDDQRSELSLRAQVIIGGVFFFLLMDWLRRFDLG